MISLETRLARAHPTKCSRTESAEREGTQNDEDIAETTDCDNDGIDDACEAGLTAADRVRMAATRWAERGDNASKSRRSLASMRADISPLLEGIDLGEHEDILQVH